MYKLREPINEVKEIVIPKRELTKKQKIVSLEGCFTGETLINTELGLRRIDSIKKGERVYAENAKTGEKSLKKVLYVYKKHSKDIIIITIGKEKLETTAPHLFYTEEGFKPAERIKAGEKIKNSNGIYKEIANIITRHTEEAIYNLNVEDYHTYFVGEGSLLVHNDCSVSNEEVKTVTDNLHITENNVANWLFNYKQFQSTPDLIKLCNETGIDSTYGVMGEAAPWAIKGDLITSGGAGQTNTPINVKALEDMGIIQNVGGW